MATNTSKKTRDVKNDEKNGFVGKRFQGKRGIQGGGTIPTAYHSQKTNRFSPQNVNTPPPNAVPPNYTPSTRTPRPSRTQETNAPIPITNTVSTHHTYGPRNPASRANKSLYRVRGFLRYCSRRWKGLLHSWTFRRRREEGQGDSATGEGGLSDRAFRTIFDGRGRTRGGYSVRCGRGVCLLGGLS